MQQTIFSSLCTLRVNKEISPIISTACRNLDNILVVTHEFIHKLIETLETNFKRIKKSTV